MRAAWFYVKDLGSDGFAGVTFVTGSRERFTECD